MNYQTLQTLFLISHQTKIPLFVWGHTGLGKSELVAQFCRSNKLGFIDYRLSQIEAAELRGLPARDNGQTVYYPPADLPSAEITWEAYQKARDAETDEYARLKLDVKDLRRVKEGVLFLDELPRAADDVQAAVFQLVRDRKIGQYILPPGWSIICAGNYLEGYQQSGFRDEAFINRFAHAQIMGNDELLSEWTSYMTKGYGDTVQPIIQCVTQDTKYLFGDRTGEMGFTTQPSPRSWEMVARVLKKHEEHNYDEDAVNLFIAGLVGTAAAKIFRTNKLPVTPRELIEDGVKKHTHTLDKHKDDRAICQGIMWGMVSYCRPRSEEQKYSKAAIDFAKWMFKSMADRDLFSAFIKLMMGVSTAQNNNDSIKTGIASNANVASLIAKLRAKAGSKRSFVDFYMEDKELVQMGQDATWDQS
jgi:MoxR-like ATPase